MIVSQWPRCIFPPTHLHQIWCKYIHPIWRYWHCPKFNMAAQPSWIFTTSEFGTFWHNGRLMLKLCIKFGSNVSYNHLYCRPFIPVVRLMTSRELTSGFDFCIFQSNSVQISLSIAEQLAFYEIQDGCRPASWICWGSHWHKRSRIRGAYPL